MAVREVNLGGTTADKPNRTRSSYLGIYSYYMVFCLLLFYPSFTVIEKYSDFILFIYFIYFLSFLQVSIERLFFLLNAQHVDFLSLSIAVD